MMTDYSNGGLDHYAAEPILFMDEFKGQLPYAVFLSMTDVYKVQLHARYANVWALWREIYITSVLSPEELYAIMVPFELRATDSIWQMLRRINDITYCHKVGSTYKRHTIPMAQYKGMQALISDATADDEEVQLVLLFPT